MHIPADTNDGDVDGNWYCAFVLEKTRIENLEALMKLADALNVSPNDISQHGTKDKIGVTTQVVTVWCMYVCMYVCVCN